MILCPRLNSENFHLQLVTQKIILQGQPTLCFRQFHIYLTIPELIPISLLQLVIDKHCLTVHSS